MPTDKHSLTFDFPIPEGVPERLPERKQPEARPPEGPRVLPVGAFARILRFTLERAFAGVLWVEGEVSGLRAVASGHVYFTLKDELEDAAVDVVMYKSSVTPRAKNLLVDGAKVKVRAKPTFWAPRGRLQLVCDRVDLSGRGALLVALEELKAKLEHEGLFRAERKRPLPESPRTIGVVTSASGAVVHDIRKVAFRRGAATLLVAPCAVQGVDAPRSIVSALTALARVQNVDVIIVARGGGSQDDLMAFNDETVVRAIAACPVPVVSAVGHEVDVTLSDFAADARAATPSQAAEMVVPDTSSLAATLREVRYRLERAMRARVVSSESTLLRLEKALGDPRVALGQKQELLDDRVERMEHVVRARLRAHAQQLSKMQVRLGPLHPRARLRDGEKALLQGRARMAAAMQRILQARARELGTRAAALDALSPLRVLGRGYAIALGPTGAAVRTPGDAPVGDELRILLGEGAIRATVSGHEEGEPKPSPKASA